MEHTFDKIASKPSDYKVCKACGRLNWYENDSCVAAENGCLSKNFSELGAEEVHEKIRSEMKGLEDDGLDDGTLLQV